MKLLKLTVFLLFVCGMIPLGTGSALGIEFSGDIYMKWLDGNRALQNGLQSNAEGNNGDQGQGTELNLLFHGTLSTQVEYGGRLNSRFNRNYWTNQGGYGGGYTINDGNISSSGEYNPLEAQYVKFRGAFVRLTPGYSWIDSATLGSNDWGQFDPMVIGKIRYIDRDNLSGLLFQGSAFSKTLKWDIARISLPKLFAGPGWSTGDFNAQDAAYCGQFKFSPMTALSFTGIVEYSRDQELDLTDTNPRNGQEMKTRVRDVVYGLKAKYSPGDWIDLGGAFYYSDYMIGDEYIRVQWSPYLNKDATDNAWKFNIDINKTFIENLSLAIEVFHIGAEYQSIMAARRESDVLLTEGHDGAFGARMPLLNNEIGFGGWDDTAQQVATMNVDNDFTDFDERMAESCLGWEGITIVPKWQIAALKLQGEFTYLDYDTNWQAFGQNNPNSTDYPLREANGSVGVNGGFRSPYAPFQDKETMIGVLNWNYDLDVGSGVNLFGKFKWIGEEDKRVTQAKYLTSGSSPWYPVSNITVGGVVIGQTTAFASLKDDDRDLDYWMGRVGAGYQLTRDLYGKVYYEYYNADLDDGTPAFTPPLGAGYWSGPYQSGKHTKNKYVVQFDYFLSGMEFGLNTQWIIGSYDPKFKGTYLLHTNDDGVYGVRLGDGSFVSASTLDFSMYRLKAWMKVKF